MGKIGEGVSERQGKLFRSSKKSQWLFFATDLEVSNKS